LAPTTTTITSVVPSPSLVGRPLTVTYAVTSSVGSPTGAVIVRASTGESCSGAAPAGSCSLVFAAPGSRWLAASYLGSATHAADTSSQVRHTVLDVPPDGLTAGSTSPTRLGAPTELFAAVDGGTGVTFDWSLGTGAAAVGPIVTYTYPAAGRFGALVAATSGGGTLTEAVTVDIVVAPQVVSTTVRTTTSGAVIRVGANPGGASTQLFVDYEPIPGGPLVSVLGATIPAGTWGPVTVAASLADLPAGTTFRYRVRLVSLAGTSASADGQFTTLSGRLFTPAAALNATP
jgi:hypothetical protein